MSQITANIRGLPLFGEFGHGSLSSHSPIALWIVVREILGPWNVFTIVHFDIGPTKLYFSESQFVQKTYGTVHICQDKAYLK